MSEEKRKIDKAYSSFKPILFLSFFVSFSFHHGRGKKKRENVSFVKAGRENEWEDRQFKISSERSSLLSFKLSRTFGKREVIV